MGLESHYKYQEALEAYDHAIELDSQNAGIWLYKVIALFGLHRDQDALRKNPQNGSGWFSLGTSFSLLEKREEAIEAYDHILLLEPEHVDAYFYKGHELFQLQREEAVTAWRKAVKIDPDYPRPWHFIGLASFELGKYEDAIEAFDRSLALDPTVRYHYVR